MKTPDYEAARRGLLGQEEQYSLDWMEDAERLADDGLYDTITKMVEPKPDEVIVDIGTGTGLQLLSLGAAEGDAITIGTERTRMNVMMAYSYLSQLGLRDALSVLAASDLRVSADERQLYWKQELHRVAGFVANVRSQLREKIHLLEDNILMPELLTHVLDGRKIDAGILSMPGGSSSRLLEWPYDINSPLTEETKRVRVKEITNRTRYAFYHFMSEHVREGGRIVVAERMLTDPAIAPAHGAQIMIAQHMQSLTQYWQPLKGALLQTEFSNTTVQLGASDPRLGHMRGDEAKEKGYAPHIAVVRYDRTDVPFNEPPLPRPESAGM